MSSSFHKIKIPLIILISLLALMSSLAPARAERKYTLGTSLDITAGVSNQIGESSFSLERLDQGIVPFYSAYPGMTFKSEGQRSSLDLDYTFVADRSEASPPVTTTSHALTGNFTARLSRTIRLRLADTFKTVPNFSTISVLKGSVMTPEGFQYAFEPQLVRSSNINNSATAGLDIDLSQKSYISFTASVAHRIYNNTVSRVFAPDQFRMEGDLSFSHHTSARQTWSVAYKIWQNDLENNYISRVHGVTLSLSRELKPNLNLMLEAGPSFSEKNKSQKSSLGYLASAQLSKRLSVNLFSGGYSHRSGDSTGLGTISESDQGSLGFSRTLGRQFSINFQASAFRQYQKSTDHFNYWSAQGSLALSRQFGKHWVASIGGSYMLYAGQAIGSNYAYRRVYASFGYRFPELWRGQR